MHRLITALAVLSATTSAAADTLQVGADKTYTLPSQAAAAANDGDVIEIDAGDYSGDVAFWAPNNLTIRGVGGRAHLIAAGNHAGGKGIWVIQGDDTVIESIEFSDASVPDENGAGIRQEGTNLTVRDCYFHDNQNGILTGADDDSDIVVERSIFANNGFGDGYTHNMYIGNVRSFTIRNSYVHHAVIGHNVKSRANLNYILYNRIMDESDGVASRQIDLPNAGRSYIIGNLIQQGPVATSSQIVGYGSEGASNPDHDLYVINNTIVNERSTGTFIDLSSVTTAAVIRNNIFVGPGTRIAGPADSGGNFDGATDGDPLLTNLATYDYHLLSGSPAADSGIEPGTGAGFDLSPTSHYLHPAGSENRPHVGTIDVGAFEFGDSVDAGPGPNYDAGVMVDGATPDADNTRDGAASSGDGSAHPDDGTMGGGCCAVGAGSSPGSNALLALIVLAVTTRRRRR